MKLSRLSALFEQGFISGSNFLILIFAARVLEPAQWGVFSFAMACVLMVQGLQRAAVILPMVNQCATPEGLRQHQSSWYRMQLFATGISIGLLLIVVWLPGLPPQHAWVAHSAAVAALLTGPIYFYEFNRRLLILRGLQNKLIWVAISYALVLGVGAAVIHLQHLESINAVLLVFLSAQLVGAMGTAALLGMPSLHMTWSAAQIAENVQFAKWAFLSSIAFSGYNFAVQAILGAFSGPGAVGLFNAARNFIQPVNTLIQAMDSVDKPRTSKMYATSGTRGLFTAVLASLRWLLLIGGPFVLLMGAFGGDLLVLVYGNHYAGNQTLMLAWAVAAGLILVAHPVETGLLVKRFPKQLFVSRLIAATVALGLAFGMIPDLGAVGAVISLATGWALAAAIGFAFLRERA
ncbi:MAG: oligosaccharide flippase family protein [Rhodoferax sp.]|nr:oligosaccharide flippase family protein [Rhodoferax sp.]